MALCLMAVLVMVGSLVTLGCDSGDEDDEGDFRDVEAGDLDGFAIVFPDGEAFDPDLRGDRVTLRVVGTNNDGVGTFTLTSGGNVAGGDITINSCTLEVDASDFPATAGPQVGDTIPLDPCEINEDTSEVCVTNEDTEVESCGDVSGGIGG
jgi:hypothetical protein